MRNKKEQKVFRIIYHYEAIPRGLVVEADTLDEAMKKARKLIQTGRDEWEETETEECFTHMSIEQAIVNEDDMSDDWDYDWDYIGQTKSDIESWRGEKNEKL